MDLRNKFKEKKELDDKKDGFVWKLQFKKLMSDMDSSADKVELLKKAL